MASDQFIVRFTRRVKLLARRCSRSIYPNLRGVFRTGDKEREKKSQRCCAAQCGARGTERTKRKRARALYVYRVQSHRLSATSRSRIYDALITMQFSMDRSGGDGGRTVHYARRIIANVATCQTWRISSGISRWETSAENEMRRPCTNFSYFHSR